MRPLIADPAMSYKRNLAGVLIGMLGAYVDYCFMGGEEEIQRLTELTLTRLQSRRRHYHDTDLIGVNFTTVPGPPRCFKLGQAAYIGSMDPLAADSPFQAFVSMRALLAWLGHTRPDLACGINKLAQVTEAAFGSNVVKDLNALVTRA